LSATTSRTDASGGFAAADTLLPPDQTTTRTPLAKPSNVVPFKTVQIDDDGGVTLLSPRVRRRKPEDDPATFDENLALKMDDGDLASLGYEIAEGVEVDEQSRSKFIETFNKSLELLGLKDETPQAGQRSRGSISRVTHPLLLEAVVKSQGAARAELLPAQGPAKVQIRGDSNAQLEDLARTLEDDFNAYLTVGAREYYPDTDRGLFGLFFSGNMFKKVYEHPLRHRPVSDTIAVEDLIVNEDAVDLETAIRISHRSRMTKGMLRRMQLFGDWLDVELPATFPQLDPATRKKQELMGTGYGFGGWRPQDTQYDIYETTTDVDLADYGVRGTPDDFPVPVVVSLERQTKKVLAVRRGWRRGDAEFRRRMRYVHYGMVPAINFLCLGHMHLLGGHARALTAAWRVILDAGMFANFPGGMKLKGVRVGPDGNDIHPQPGEWPDIDAAGIDDIRKVVMPMPYKEASAVFIQFINSVASEAKSLAATIDVEMGEGRTNIPVGSMMAMIEQASQLSAIIHKRLHTAQTRELELFKELVAENPEAILKVIPNPQKRWVGQLAFNNVDLVPVSDPNVPSQIHRVMLATAMVTMAGQNPDIYNRLATHQRAWRTIGVGDADSFLQQPPPQGAPQGDPAAMMAAQAQMTKAQADMQNVQAKQQENQRKAATETVEAQMKTQQQQAEMQDSAAERAIKLQVAQVGLNTEQIRQETERVRSQAQADTADAKVAASHMQIGVHAAQVGVQQANQDTAEAKAKAAQAAAKAAAAKPKSSST
jgi:hypothetical protein